MNPTQKQVADALRKAMQHSAEVAKTVVKATRT